MQYMSKNGRCCMTNEIINLLPSADLKAKIKETGHQFTESELLQIIYNYAPTFDEKLSMLEQFSKIASSDVSALAKAYIEYEHNNFNEFIEQSPRFVYELHIKETPDSHDECYICASYNAALLCIDRFYEEYSDIGASETEKTKYRIIKRKIFFESDKFEEDTYAECILGAGKVVLEISDCKSSSDCKTKVFYGTGELKYDYKDSWNVYLKGTYYSWDGEGLYVSVTPGYEWDVYGLLPEFEINAGVGVKVLDGLKVNLGYEFVKRHDSDSYDPISNLYAGADYALLKNLNVFAQVNNLLNKEYVRYDAYPAQKLNFLAGLSLQF